LNKKEFYCNYGEEDNTNNNNNNNNNNNEINTMKKGYKEIFLLIAWELFTGKVPK